MRLWKKVLLLSVVSFVLISANIGGYSIYILDEAKNTQCAREMADRGDWIVPTFNGTLRTDKPPLHYFFMRLAYQVFGDGAYGARFFSALFGVLTVLMTFFFTRRFISEQAAFFSAAVLLCSPGFIFQFHLAVPDPYLIFFIGGSICSYFTFDQTSQKKFLYLAYLAVGLGALTKGPIAIVLPGMAIFFYMMYKRKLSIKGVLDLRPLIGIALILLIAAPWYILVHLETEGAWTQGFFLDHNVNRFNSPKEGHGGNFWLPTAFVFIMLLPFAVFLPQSISRVLREKSDILTFSLITMACMILFFSISSTKLPSYTSPMFPFAAILIGSYLATPKEWKWSHWVSLILFGMITIALFVGSKPGIEQAKEISHLGYLQWYFLSLPIGFLAVLVFVWKKKYTSALAAIGISFLILHQLAFYIIYPEINKQNTVIKTWEYVKDEPNLIAFERLNAGYVHALDRIIPHVYTVEEVQAFLGDHPNAIIFTRPEYLQYLEAIDYIELTREPDMFDGTTTVILKAQ